MSINRRAAPSITPCHHDAVQYLRAELLTGAAEDKHYRLWFWDDRRGRWRDTEGTAADLFYRRIGRILARFSDVQVEDRLAYEPFYYPRNPLDNQKPRPVFEEDMTMPDQLFRPEYFRGKGF